VLILESGGGGGWGNPADREPAALAADRDTGFVTDLAISVQKSP